MSEQISLLIFAATKGAMSTERKAAEVQGLSPSEIYANWWRGHQKPRKNGGEEPSVYVPSYTRHPHQFHSLCVFENIVSILNLISLLLKMGKLYGFYKRMSVLFNCSILICNANYYFDTTFNHVIFIVRCLFKLNNRKPGLALWLESIFNV